MNSNNLFSDWKHFVVIALGCTLITAGRPVSVSAGATTVIAFGETDRDIGNHGSMLEGDYVYNAVGQSWSLQNGGPPAPLDPFPTGSALVTFWGIEPAVGNYIDFSRVDAQPFRFLSIDLRGRLVGQRNDVVFARGFRDGAEVASQLFQSSSEVWRTDSANPAFATPIDLLRFELVEYNRSALIVDNLTFELVPEPSACVLVLIGAAAVTRTPYRRTSAEYAPSGEQCLRS